MIVIEPVRKYTTGSFLALVIGRGQKMFGVLDFP
jgi:hypothetical protein